MFDIVLKFWIHWDIVSNVSIYHKTIELSMYAVMPVKYGVNE